LKKILIASTVALFVGGWWFGAGGTYGSGEEALEKAKEWEAKGRTWTVTKTKTKKVRRKVRDPNHPKLLNEYNLALEKYSNAYDNNSEICQSARLNVCLQFLENLRKPVEYNTKLVDAIEKEEVEKSTRTCRNQGWAHQDNFQVICKERPYKAKHWKGAKYVYFKVK
jgi:hypothetical protein